MHIDAGTSNCLPSRVCLHVIWRVCVPLPQLRLQLLHSPVVHAVTQGAVLQMRVVAGRAAVHSEANTTALAPSGELDTHCACAVCTPVLHARLHVDQAPSSHANVLQEDGTAHDCESTPGDLVHCEAVPALPSLPTQDDERVCEPAQEQEVQSLSAQSYVTPAGVAAEVHTPLRQME